MKQGDLEGVAAGGEVDDADVGGAVMGEGRGLGGEEGGRGGGGGGFLASDLVSGAAGERLGERERVCGRERKRRRVKWM